MDMHGHTAPSPSASAAAGNADPGPMSYFAYGKHSGAIVAHIVLMVLAWFFVLPVGVMFSVARSRLALPTQFLFLVINAFGVLLGIIYNTSTPDLYENNSHNKIGWIITWVVSAEVVMGVLFAYADKDERTASPSHEQAGFLPVSTSDSERQHQYRWSRDSGQGTERSSSSLQQSRFSSLERGRRLSRTGESDPLTEKPEDDDDDDETEAPMPVQRRFFKNNAVDKFLRKRVPNILSSRVLKVLRVIHTIIERTILPFGFVAMVTGCVVYGGIFRGNNIFNGLAHFIKGGIFFWYGLLTLGRWLGCFADFGWAWNVKPSRALVGWKARIPTGEFTESFVIFLYGCSNVFLEHLAAWGEAWSAQDLEHVSISVMFFGGGLCGMLAESKRVREWINKTALPSPEHPELHYAQTSSEELEPPKTQGLSLNPLPALVILLLGLMMSSHHQDSMVSTMVHSQWGMLLVGFSVSRAVTYVLLYLNPPSSLLPARPPTELVASFCLISGGIIFMLSTKDVIAAMEYHDLHAMFVFTVAMGFTAFIMAWEIACISLKAWATKRTDLAVPRGFRFPHSA